MQAHVLSVERLEACQPQCQDSKLQEACKQRGHRPLQTKPTERETHEPKPDRCYVADASLKQAVDELEKRGRAQAQSNAASKMTRKKPEAL